MKEKIINRHKAFTDLTKPENLKKINIDKNLVPYFINVMNKFQEFFEAKGLMSATNFALLFEEYLLADNKKKYSLEIKNSYNFSGVYIPGKRKIIVSKKFFDASKNYPEVIESVLTHEFIHFIAMTTLPWIENKDGDFVQYENYFQEHFVEGGFIAEGFTQALTELMYPGSLAYYPYTSMMRMYLNAFSTEDYFSFIRGRLPGKTYFSNKVTQFMTVAERLFSLYYSKQASWEEEIKHPYYQESFNLLVDAFKEKIELEIERFEFVTVQEFAERIYNFKALAIFKSGYLENGIDYLITEFVSKYFTDLSLEEQFKIKQEITYFIDSDMLYLTEPNLNAIYKIPSEQDGYYCEVKSYDDYLNLQSYSPEGILLRKEKIASYEGQEGSFNLGSAIAEKNKVVDFYIEDNSFFVRLYDESLNLMPDEEFDKLDEKELPKLYNLPLYNEEARKDILEKEKESKQVLDKLNALIDNQSFVVMDIVRKDKDLFTVMKVGNIFDGDTEKALYVSSGEGNDFRFFYVSGKYYKEINTLSKNLIKLPISNNKNIFVSLNIKGDYINAVSFDENGKNHKDLALSYVYYASKPYINNIKDKEEYSEYTNYEM